MTFLFKPTGGPDSVGGIWPAAFPSVACRNRSGTTHIKGDVVQLAFTPGAATEIATNDSNSYRPGSSNDTVWNTIIDPVNNSNQGASIQRGGTLFGVCMSTSVTDNSIGNYQFFGLIEDAFCIKTGTDHAAAGDPLTVTTSGQFDGVINSNEVVVATYLDTQTGLTNATLRRVFLHNGLLAQSRGKDGATAFT